jgi:hypothetical protein
MGLPLFFVAQVITLAAFWIYLGGQRAAVAIGLWLAVTGGASYAGLLQFVGFPPPIAAVILSGLAITFGLAFSRFGAALIDGAGIQILIGYQGFRILVEVFLYWGHAEGLVPRQMTWEGRNLDVLTGLTAIPVALWATSKTVVWLWNLAGLLLLINVVTVAILSMPTPFQVFSPRMVFVADWPYVWLPAFLVTSALFGHLLVFRWLRREDVDES